MKQFLEKYHYYLLAAVVILAAVLIFSGLNRVDLQHDDATYAFRSVGYLDFMNAGTNQTTPLQWFDANPWWAGLSFHDHPPLVFLVQHAFFKVFGSSDFVARLPFALAGVASVLALYLLARFLYDRNLALLAGGLLAISSYHAWASKVGYLEGLATPLIIFTLAFLVKGLQDKKFLYLFGVFLGLTVLAKYTTVFILPAIFVYLVVSARKTFFQKDIWLAGIIALMIFSPVLIYNWQMLTARGHFDLQLSILFNQSRADWPGITRGVASPDLLALEQVLYQSYSILLFILLLISLILLAIKFFTDWKKPPHLLVLATLFFGVVFFSFISPEVRFVSVLNPLMALVLALGIFEIQKYISQPSIMNNFKKLAFFSLIALAIGFEIFYNINTNILPTAIGQKVKHFSPYRWEAGGFDQLEKFLLANNLILTESALEIKSVDDVRVDIGKISGRDIFIYDPDLNWFSTLWYFNKYSVYYDGNIFLSAAELALHVEPKNWVPALKQEGARNMYYIDGLNEVVVASDLNKVASLMLAKSLAQISSEVFEVKNNKGEPAFKIYKIILN